MFSIETARKSPNNRVESARIARSTRKGDAPFARGLRGTLGHMKNKALATIVILLAASLVALSAMIHGAGGFEWNWFYPWVIGPYAVLLLIFCLPARQSDARSLAGRVAAVLVLMFTCLLYIDAMWVSVSSTSALIFIFGPMYLLVGGLFTWGVAWSLLARRNAKKKDHA